MLLCWFGKVHSTQHRVLLRRVPSFMLKDASPWYIIRSQSVQVSISQCVAGNLHDDTCLCLCTSKDTRQYTWKNCISTGSSMKSMSSNRYESEGSSSIVMGTSPDSIFDKWSRLTRDSHGFPILQKLNPWKNSNHM